MEQRVDAASLIPEGYKAVYGLEQHVRSKVKPDLLHLVKLRASILNGCTFCTDMHSTDAITDGAEARRVFAVAAWHESPWFTPAERAAFALTDVLTRLDGGVADEVWDDAVTHHGEAGAVELALAVATINVWNRLAIAVRMQPPPLAS